MKKRGPAMGPALVFSSSGQRLILMRMVSYLLPKAPPLSRAGPRYRAISRLPRTSIPGAGFRLYETSTMMQASRIPMETR